MFFFQNKPPSEHVCCIESRKTGCDLPIHSILPVSTHYQGDLLDSKFCNNLLYYIKLFANTTVLYRTNINEMEGWPFDIALPSVATTHFIFHSSAGLFNLVPSQFPGEYSATRHKITCTCLALYNCLVTSTHSHLARMGV